MCIHYIDLFVFVHLVRFPFDEFDDQIFFEVALIGASWRMF